MKRKISINKKAKRELDRYPMVEVQWTDIISDSGWQNVASFAKAKLPICVTKGHLLSQAKGLTKVFGDFALKNQETGEIDEIGNATIIPTSVIIKIMKLR
jgi:hypothetical protein